MKNVLTVLLLLTFVAIQAQVNDTTKTKSENQQIIEQNKKIIEQNNKILNEEQAKEDKKAKQDEAINKKSSSDKANDIASKIFMGAKFGLAINSNNTTMILEPFLGYMMSERVHFGTKFSYRHSRNYTVEKQTYNDYGGSVFARFYALPFLYFHIEPAFLNYQVLSDNSVRETVPFLWVGNGIRRKTSKTSWVSLEVLMDIYNHKNSPYRKWQPFFTVGAGFSF